MKSSRTHARVNTLYTCAHSSPVSRLGWRDGVRVTRDASARVHIVNNLKGTTFTLDACHTRVSRNRNSSASSARDATG